MLSSNSKLTSDDVLEILLKSKKIVVVCGNYYYHCKCNIVLTYSPGAGISVAAGIPSFRGGGGLYTHSSPFSQFSGNNLVDLFTWSSLNVSGPIYR
jgi:hypothetical protein